jgi:PAS domain S-box-containing protein
MMQPLEDRADHAKFSRLLDENEQLRTELESSLEENSRIIEDRDRLLRRVAVLARELQNMNAARAADVSPMREPISGEESRFKQNQAEEELRVAFEELQVLAEELEVANFGLQQANDELEARVQARTRELSASNADLKRIELRLNTLIEGMPQLVWRAVGVGDWTWCSPQWSDLTGQSVNDSQHWGWLNAFHPDDRPVAMDAWSHAESTGGLSFEGRLCDAKRGRYRHFQTRASPVRTPEGAVIEWLGTCTDIDDILRLQDQQAVLVTELQHRTRNLMAVVYAVTMRTVKGARTLDDFRRCIDDRLGALSRVQGLLSRRGSQRIAFDTLLREELSAHIDLDRKDGEPRVLLEGPADVPLESALVQTFALALHELATNAVKYGALAAPDGRLTVRWRIVRSDTSGARLHVDWRETGVSDMPVPDAAPRGGGYGRELIERALPYQLGASTHYGFTKDGVHCTIEVDIPADDPRKELAVVRPSA